MFVVVDENIIGVVVILGIIYIGEFEFIVEICVVLDKLVVGGGVDVLVYVDVVSGGFVVLFLYLDLVWDFWLFCVVLINVSGYKYGLIYFGVGFVVWCGFEYLLEDLVFWVNYFGGDMLIFILNFFCFGN